MADHKNGKHTFSRRTFLKGMQWAPAVFLPAPLFAGPFRLPLRNSVEGHTASSSSVDAPWADIRLSPHYPTPSPLDDLFRLVPPGSDEYVTEGYAAEVTALLEGWGQHLKADPPGLTSLSGVVDSSIQFTALAPIRESSLRTGSGIEVVRREFAPELVFGRERFLDQLKNYLAPLTRVEA